MMLTWALLELIRFVFLFFSIDTIIISLIKFRTRRRPDLMAKVRAEADRMFVDNDGGELVRERVCVLFLQLKISGFVVRSQSCLLPRHSNKGECDNNDLKHEFLSSLVLNITHVLYLSRLFFF